MTCVRVCVRSRGGRGVFNDGVRVCVYYGSRFLLPGLHRRPEPPPPQKKARVRSPDACCVAEPRMMVTFFNVNSVTWFAMQSAWGSRVGLKAAGSVRPAHCKKRRRKKRRKSRGVMQRRPHE